MTDPKSWVDAYGDRLFRYAFSRVRDQASAEDLVQETFLAALESRAKFKAESSELTWMTGILRNKIFEHYRKQSKETPLGDDDGSREDDLFDGRHWTPAEAPREWPQAKAESAELGAALRRCLEGLTAPVARAFVLREMEGLDAPAAAEALGVPPAHLAVLLYRARLRLRRCLEKNHFAPGAA
ncbi:MAG: sigma-70 family RNA polymerase sigma factor [Elusimicrobiota bacterium]|nr:MAG: sigma-70 family RNA polymerase sigma factor [Elusimicrobiota bacterium]